MKFINYGEVEIFLLKRLSLMISAILAPFSVEIEVENKLTAFKKCQKLQLLTAVIRIRYLKRFRA